MSGGRAVTSTTTGSWPGRDERLDLAGEGGRGAVQRQLDHGHGLGRELDERTVAVHALAQVDLGHRRQPEPSLEVEQEPEVDAVALDERQLLEQLAAAGVLAGQRLDEPGQLRAQEADHGSRHELGHPAATRAVAFGSVVEALHEPDVGAGQERAEEPDHERRDRSCARRRRTRRRDRRSTRRATSTAPRPCRDRARSSGGSRRPRPRARPHRPPPPRCDRSSGRRPRRSRRSAPAPRPAVTAPLRTIAPTVSCSSRAGRQSEIVRPAFAATRSAASNSPERKVRNNGTSISSWSPTGDDPGKAERARPVACRRVQGEEQGETT